MADFNYAPAPEFGKEVSPRVLVARYGDGYEQRLADGINTRLRVWDLTFGRSTADADAIEAFLESKNGVTSFTWRLPTGGDVRVVCSAWRRIERNKSAVITAQFREVLA